MASPKVALPEGINRWRWTPAGIRPTTVSLEGDLILVSDLPAILAAERERWRAALDEIGRLAFDDLREAAKEYGFGAPGTGGKLQEAEERFIAALRGAEEAGTDA